MGVNDDELKVELKDGQGEVEAHKLEEEQLREIYRVLVGPENHQIQVRGLPSDPQDIGVIAADVLLNFAKAYEAAGLGEAPAAFDRMLDGLEEAFETMDKREGTHYWKRELNS